MYLYLFYTDVDTELKESFLLVLVFCYNVNMVRVTLL